jgi:D-sedoheptulose 7-phosphate isomerase
MEQIVVVKTRAVREKQVGIFRNYLAGLGDCIDEISRQDLVTVADLIFQAYLKGKQVFIFGNGGSASTASHFARDLRIGTAAPGKPRVKSLCLADSVALITSLANDIDYESVFVEPLIGQVERGDVAIGISCSGNSPNVLKAIDYAHRCGAFTIGLAAFGGGRLRATTDKCIVLSTRDYGQAEDIHLALGHILTYLVRERIQNGR